MVNNFGSSLKESYRFKDNNALDSAQSQSSLPNSVHSIEEKKSNSRLSGSIRQVRFSAGSLQDTRERQGCLLTNSALKTASYDILSSDALSAASSGRSHASLSMIQLAPVALNADILVPDKPAQASVI
jgi:hypothetical protein